MLTNLQIRTLLNNIFMLPICRTIGVKLNQLQKNAAHTEYIANIAVGAGYKNQWILKTMQSTSTDKMFIIMSNGIRKIRLTVNMETMQLDDSSVSMLTNLLLTYQYLVSHILYQIVNVGCVYDSARSDEYHRIYPSNSSPLDIMCIIDGKERVKLDQSDKNATLNQPLSKVNHLTVDLVSYETGEMVPLYHIIFENDAIAIARYLNTGSTHRLSTHADRVSTKDSLTADDSDETSIYSKINDLVEGWSIAENDRTIVDRETTDKQVTEKHRIALGYVGILQQRSIPIKSADNTIASDSAILQSEPIIGYGIDDFYDVYPLDSLKVRVTVTRSTKKRFCISYSCPMMGTIAAIYVDGDVNYIADQNKVTKNDLIVLSGDDTRTAILSYNSGRGGTETIDRINIERALVIVRELVSLSAVACDIEQSVKYFTNDIYKSAKLPLDNIYTSTSYYFTVLPEYDSELHVNIISQTTSMTIPVACFIERSGSEVKISCQIANKKAYRMSNNSIFKQSLSYDGTEIHNLGQLLAAEIVHVCTGSVDNPLPHNLKKNVIQHKENTLAKTAKVLRFQSSSPVGSLLLDVRDAFVNTFGPGVFGYGPDHKSNFDSKMNFGDFYYNITTLKDGKQVPIEAECSIYGDGYLATGGGRITTKYKDDHKVHAECSFNNHWVEIELDGDRLSPEFLEWYLGASGNQVTSTIYRAIRNNATEKLDKEGNIIYKIDPLVIKIVKSLYDDSSAPQEPLSNLPKGTKTNRMYLAPDIDVNQEFNGQYFDENNQLRNYSDLPEEERALAAYDDQMRQLDASGRMSEDDEDNDDEESPYHYSDEVSHRFDKWKGKKDTDEK